MIRKSILTLAPLFCGCLLASAQTTPPQMTGYHKVFEEDFRHFDLSPDGGGMHNWYEGIWYSRQHAPMSNIYRTQDGLHLSWTADQPSYDTSISTMGHNGNQLHAWRYGYFEVRMKWNPVRGAWPALWLIPAQTGHQVESGELDIFEGDADNPHTYFGTIHHWHETPDHSRMERVESNAGRNKYSLAPWFDYSQYHTYALMWEPTQITWFLDGKILHAEPAFPVFAQTQDCLILGMQAGAEWKEGNVDRTQTPRLDMDIAWVRVWQR